MNNFKLVLNLSLRNLWRQRRRNSILLVAITVAIGGVIVLNSLIRGMQVQMVDSVVENLSGHIKMHAPNYRDDPSMERGFVLDPRGVERAIEGLPVLGWAARISIPAVIMSERETRGATLIGVDPDQEHISIISRFELEGESLKSASDSRILVGRALVEELRTKLGRRIVITTLDSNGMSKEIGFRIAGVYDAESESFEKSLVFSGRNALQELLGSSKVTEVSIRLKTRYAQKEDFEQVRDSFLELDVLDWQQANPIVAFMYNTVNLVIYIWLGIVLGALVFGLVNTLITAVLERIREFGLFRAVGMRPRIIIAQVVSESVCLMLLGIVFGVTGSLLIFAWLHNGIDLSAFASGVEMMGMSSQMKPALVAHDVLVVVLVSVVLAVVASFYPARRAVRMNPLDALRH
ncbi:MAG: ABC transporter permease [Gammaproteobacteria bacterium]|nr:ABC transporter permease [Gammaproteobacteria bacterium]